MGCPVYDKVNIKFCPQFVSALLSLNRITLVLNEPHKNVAFFPQMKPEKKAIEMTEDEKVVFNILKDNSPIELPELKGQTGLSNKKWDKAIKGLTKNKVAKVENTDAGLLVTAL